MKRYSKEKFHSCSFLWGISKLSCSLGTSRYYGYEKNYSMERFLPTCILLYTIETCEVANSVENFHRNCYMAALDKNVCFVLFAQHSHVL